MSVEREAGPENKGIANKLAKFLSEIAEASYSAFKSILNSILG